MFTATILKRAWFPKDKGGRNVKPWTHEGKSMCHLPLSHPATTFNVLLISWGIYCWRVECGRTVSPCPHAHSTRKLTLTMAENHYPITACRLSMIPLSLLLQGTSFHSPHGWLFIFLMLSWDKRIHDPLYGGSFSIFSMHRVYRSLFTPVHA